MKGKQRVYAVYDISSSSVAGAHVLAHTTDKGSITATFLASVRIDAPLQEDMEIKRFVDDTVKHLEMVVTRIGKADVHHPTSIQLVLASPWYRSQTRTIVYKKETPFVCTQKLIDSLVDTEIKYILEHEEGSFGVFGKESTIVEKQISAVTLNGYATTVPIGKRAEELELSVAITIAPKPILDKFTDVLRRAYGTRPISFTTSPHTTFVTLRDRGLITDAAVIIDVGEEVTDIAFIKEGILLYQHSFPVGTYGLYRSLLTTGTHTALEAVAILESYRLGSLSPNESKAAERAITEYSAQWQAGFRQVLDEKVYGCCMPAHCILTVDPRFETLLKTIITTDPFIAHSCSYQTVEVTLVDAAMFRDTVDTADDTPLDIPLATGALFVERFV